MSRWSTTAAAVMWITTVAASLAGVFAVLLETGVIGGHEPTPIDRGPVVVTIAMADGGTMRGFFTPAGQIVSVPMAAGGLAAWNEGGEKVSARLEVVAARSQLVLLAPAGRQGPRVDYAIRTATSLREGDSAVLHLGPSQRTSGRVLRLDAGRLVTTRVSALGDLCAPILDDQDRVIGMVASQADATTLSWPIEYLRAEFPSAF